MITDNIGLYIHIPFCVRKCAYCDFASFSNVAPDVRSRYIERLCEEIEGYKRDKKIGVDTVFFGGGTPSLLSPDELSNILAQARCAFDISPDAEITMEMNPGTLTPESARAYAALGVNRASIGCQSFNENELKILGRIHDSKQVYDAVKIVRDAGITNISLDLMYGIPEQTAASFKNTLAQALSLDPAHLSVYGLILEEGTPFFDARKKLPLPTEDEECDMYALASKILSEHGFSHYEISNYARPGYECRHNLKYWRDEEYIGVGLAAYSYFGKKRFGNTSRLDEYISDSYVQYRYGEDISHSDEAFEYVMMRLRLSEGFSLSDYRARFGVDFACGREEKIARYRALGYIDITADRLTLTERGFYISNTILSDLL
jgi:oxygen-independent coproporphyrinogen-3 oxidase